MPDIVLDTNVFADFLAQYLQFTPRSEANFAKQGCITKELARRINQIVRWHDRDATAGKEQASYPGRVVASTLAFVEMARKWNEIVQGRFRVEQLAAFVSQPPDWFVIESMDEVLVMDLCDVPTEVMMANGEREPVEWTDAVHVATAFGRGHDALLATTDSRIRQMTSLRDRLV